MFAEVGEVLQNYTDAVYEKDVEKFLSGYAPDVHLFDCWNSWEIDGIEEWKTAVTAWFSGLEKVDGSWRITHEHSSLPISREDGKAIFG